MKRQIEHKQQIFPVILSEEKEGGYFVTNPAFEGCYSQGETIEEALTNIKEATLLCAEELEVEGESPTTQNISLHLIHA